MQQEIAPDPDQTADLAEFIEALGRLRLWAGGPSYRVLAKRVGPLLRPPQIVAHTTVTEVFQPHRRRLDLDLVTAIVRALGVEGRAVEQWRAACVRVHAAAKSGGQAGVFRQLPPDLATFTGRETVLRQLIDTAGTASVEGRATTVVVSAIEGMAGIGKTQLAIHAAHELVRAGRFADVQLFVNLRGFDPEYPPTEPATVLDAFLRQLDVPAQHIPAAREERAAMYRDRMHGRAAVVVLDNAADEAQVRDLIPAGPNHLVLVTSRRSISIFDDAAILALDMLDPEDSVRLLARIAGAERVEAEPASARRVAELCGGLPLAVSIAAARLRSRPAWQLQDLADRLEQGLGEIATGGRGVAGVFDLSYRGLPEPARRMLRLLGIHPGLDFTAASVAAPAGMDAAEAERALELLLDENLVQQRAAGRYEIHDLLRAYAAERAEAELTEDERRELVRTALGWQVAAVSLTALAVSPDRVLPPIDPALAARSAPQAESSAEAVLWYGRERANLMQAVAEAGRLGFDSLAWRLPVAMAYFEELAQNYPELERLMSDALPHARESDGAEPDAETDVVRWLAFALTAQDRAAEAIGPLSRVLEARRAAGDALRTGRILGSLSQAHAYSGDPDRGLQFGLEAIRTIEEAGGPVPSSFLTVTAAILHKLGRPLEALEYHLAFVQRARKAEDPRALALGRRNAGATNIHLGRTEDAAEAFEEAVAVAAEVGDRYVQADCLNGLALCLKAAGLVEEARARHREAVAVFEDLPEEEAARFLERLSASDLCYMD